MGHIKKRLCSAILICLSFALPAAKKESISFTIIAGKNATAEKSVLIAHNKNSIKSNPYVYINKFKREDFDRKVKSKADRYQWKFPAGFIQIQINRGKYASGSSFMNEYGVVMAANFCASRENRLSVSEGGIGHYLMKIVIKKARTAREAVAMAGGLIAKYGFTDSGMNYAIADASEGWFLHVVKGRRWIARRIPDNEVAVISNRFTIDKVDLKSEKEYMGSKDIISYAKNRGWLKKRAKKFNFAKTYGAKKSQESMGNILRQWRATNLLSRHKYQIEDQLPFSFIPRRVVKVTDLFEVLRDHYEGTEYDLTDGYKKGSPNATKNKTICSLHTQYAFVGDLKSDLPRELNHTLWIALKRPDTNAFSPIYYFTNPIPSGYSSQELTHSDLKQKKGAFVYFSELSRLVDQKYGERIKKTKKKWRSFEKYAIKQIYKRRKEFIYILKKNPLVGKKIITNFIHSLEYRKWFLTTELIGEFRSFE